MKHVKTIGIDIAKNVFQLFAVTANGKKVFTKRLNRKDLLAFLAQQPNKATIVMEACSSAHYWSRQFELLGFKTKLISPQYVKPFVQGNKNDANDARAIVSAYMSPEMRFVPPKTIKQQDLQSLHRVRSIFMKTRNSYANQIRGLLGEYGVTVSQGIHKLKSQIPDILEDADNELTVEMRAIIQDIFDQFKHMDNKVTEYDQAIAQQAESLEACQLLMKLPGIGPMTATGIVSAVGDAQVFHQGREMAAWLGLTPRHQSSGNKQVTLGVSKRGDRYLRTLFVQGANAVLIHCKKKSDHTSQWAQDKLERLGKNKAAIALANKMARQAWAVLSKRDQFVFS